MADRPFRGSAGDGSPGRRIPVSVLLATGSLLLRGTPDVVRVGLARAASLAGDTVPLVTAALSAFGATNLALVGLGLEWMLLAYVVYGVLPRVFPGDEPASSVLDRPGTKLLVVGVVLAIAVPATVVAPSPFSTPRTLLPLGPARYERWFLLALGTGWACSSLFVYARAWRGLSTAEKVDLIDQLTGEEMGAARLGREREALSRRDWAGWVSNLVTVAGVGGILTVTGFVLGIVATFANLLFPLFEVAVLVGAALVVWGKLAPERLSSGDRSVRERTGGIEPTFLASFRYALASRKGFFLVPVIVFGAFLTATILFLLAIIGVVAFSLILYNVLRQPDVAAGALLPVWNALGYTLCLATPPLYAVWFWIRELSRLPHFLVYWEGEKPGSAEIESVEELPPLVTRPPFTLLPPTLLWGPVAVVLLETSVTGPAALSSPVYALGWPPLLGAVIASVWWTYRREPQHPRTDNRAVQVAIVVQAGWLLVLRLLGPSVVPISPGEVAVLVVLLLALYHVPDLFVFVDELDVVPDGEAHAVLGFVAGVVMVAGALVAAAAGLGLPRPMAAMLETGGVFLVGLSCLSPLLRRLAGEP